MLTPWGSRLRAPGVRNFMIIVKYKQVYKYDFVKFGKHYKHRFVSEDYDILQDNINPLEWARSNGYYLIWSEQHPNT